MYEVKGRGSIVDETRQEQLDYCFDYFRDFVDFAETYAPDIVKEFCERHDWRYAKWLRGGVVVKMGGGADGNTV